MLNKKSLFFVISLLIVGMIIGVSTGCKPINGSSQPELGFSYGNIGQGGLMAGDNKGTVYYRSETDHWHLYKAKLDGTEKQKLSNNIPCDINVLNDWVYYSNFSDNFAIYKIKTDGTQDQKIMDGYCQHLYVVGDLIYFDIRDKDNASNIHSIKLDGAEDKLLIPEARLSYYYEDNLYYIFGEKLSLWKYNNKTQEKVQLTGNYTYYPVVNKTGIYYWNVNETTFVHSDLGGKNPKTLLKGIDYFNVDNNYVYFQKFGKNYDYYKFSLTDNKETQITAFLPGFFNEKGDFLERTNLPSTIINPNIFHEAGTSTYIIEGHIFIKGMLRQAMLEKGGRLDCLIYLDGSGNMKIWD